ncbi:MAG: CpsD/CapB family tyrosine-protein kinase [Candidatus Omnitrophica bacterium]|nr:CpsD/CapB family tyrosine-protein kinase [Candidatus Omnitrophota bacterium]
MGKITNALKKAAEERVQRIDKISKIKEMDKLVVQKMGESNVSPNVITYFDPKALITEQYKILRTNFLSLNKNKPPKTVAITSSLHSEGKTVTSLNLAVVLAQSVNKPKVLLIDGDMRRGKMGKYLGVDRTAGLAEVLTGQCSIKDALFQVDIENLTLMSSGEFPENPAELLASDEMKKLLNRVAADFDFVLIDTPPIISVTDSGTVGAMVDGVVMVVQAGRTQRGIVRRAEELLHQAHCNVVGHVLTNIEYHLPEYIYRYL